MTEGRATFPIEPWALTEVGLDHSVLGVHESVFALANGHIGMRGTFEEGEYLAISALVTHALRRRLRHLASRRPRHHRCAVVQA